MITWFSVHFPVVYQLKIRLRHKIPYWGNRLIDIGDRDIALLIALVNFNSLRCKMSILFVSIYIMSIYISVIQKPDLSNKNYYSTTTTTTKKEIIICFPHDSRKYHIKPDSWINYTSSYNIDHYDNMFLRFFSYRQKSAQVLWCITVIFISSL